MTLKDGICSCHTIAYRKYYNYINARSSLFWQSKVFRPKFQIYSFELHLKFLCIWIKATVGFFPTSLSEIHCCKYFSVAAVKQSALFMRVRKKTQKLLALSEVSVSSEWFWKTVFQGKKLTYIIIWCKFVTCFNKTGMI